MHRCWRVLADGTAVAAQEGQWLATSFHPELTGDPRFHAYFLDLVRQDMAQKEGTAS